MIKWFKKHFIPHENNDHRPHILRNYNMRNIVGIVLLLEMVTFLLPTLSYIDRTGQMAAVLPAILASITNDERQSQNLDILVVNDSLNKAAEMKAVDMATNGYFAHISPDGKTPWYWIEKVGYEYQYAGENLAVDFSDSKDVVNAWMNSPTHKSNIIKKNYTEVGTGIAKGIYEGKETVFVAQIYANPIQKTAKQKQNTKEDVKTTKEIPFDVKTEKSSNVLGAETVADTINTPTKSEEKVKLFQKLIASPRNTTNIILYVCFGIILFALLLYIVIKTRNHHKEIITNGLIILAIIGAIFIANYYFSYKNMVITQSFDYSNENK